MEYFEFPGSINSLGQYQKLGWTQLVRAFTWDVLRSKSNQVKLQVEFGSPVSQVNTVMSLFSIGFFSKNSVKVPKKFSLTFFLPKKEKVKEMTGFHESVFSSENFFDRILLIGCSCSLKSTFTYAVV